MPIGLRTVKTAISATLAILLANAIGLINAPSAGIIAVLSLTNTKRSSLYTGISRLAALALATIVAGICFRLLGYTTIAFGIYLLMFIPIAVYLKLSEGIVVCSVLVTHYLIEKTVAWELIVNEFGLMFIGVGFALLLNSYMPNIEKQLKADQEKIEETFRTLLLMMSKSINQSVGEGQLMSIYQDLVHHIRSSEQRASNFQENQWFSKNLYYSDYFAMRRAQAQILVEMIAGMEKIHVADHQVENIQFLLNYTSEIFSEKNDGRAILNKITEVYEAYRLMSLPETREEFENRAELFQFLQSFKSFIEIKAEFAKDRGQKGN